MNAYHLTAGARAGLALVSGDAERCALLARVAAALGGRLLAYCLMDTHVHVVAEGPAAELSRDLTAALIQHGREVNRHRGLEGRLLRGPVEAVRAPSAVELARMIRYVHENPTRTAAPIVRRAVEYRWSSGRAYAGLTLAPLANVARALALLGPSARRAAGPGAALADARPATAPGALPEQCLAAAAEAHGLAPEALSGPGRGPRLVAARSLFLHLARLESYPVARVAHLIGRSQPQASRLAARRVDERDLRVARSLLRDPGIRGRLLGDRGGVAGRAAAG